MTQEAAEACAAAGGAEMGRCILALYRSARQPALTEWGQQLDAAQRRPLLVISATEDAFVGGPELAHRNAERFGAQEVVLDGLGHWWMLQDPARGAAALAGFLSEVAG
jgi:pimeloyl-ACP methyl ester carboxylesterase